MSLSYRAIASRANNAAIQNHNRVANFLLPISKGKPSKSGQVINTIMLPYSSINQTAPHIDVNSMSGVEIAYYSYKPVSISSVIMVEYFTTYSVTGSASPTTDAFGSSMFVNNTQISNGYQQWLNGSGTGTRSGVIFPLMGSYENTDYTSKTITIKLAQTSGDDTVRVYGNTGTWLKITEVQR